ncbi:MAG: prephenate dehydrogenase/arogenate dehydrogenase family protein [Candidatus Bathyarchaeia archaeon]|nr:prephenate dehydrogenase/arogenate dehydrogenase family protein [Candidatus Bathyarchaeota archaeon]
MIVAIIGGAGRMGTYFARYFLERGHEVIISDIRMEKAREVAKQMRVKLSENNILAVKEANLVLISTPIEVTPKVLTEIMPEVDKCTVIAEIASLKSKILPALREAAARGIRVLSLHPLFGPGVQRLSGEKIALVPVVDLVVEKELAEKIFPEATIIPVDYSFHDKVMALTLALTHFINIVFASVISEEDIGILKRLGGTTFTLQYILSGAVMNEDPFLYASIQMDNEYAITYLDKMIEKAMSLRNVIKSRDHKAFIDFYKEIRNLLLRDADFMKTYEKMYRALEAVRREDC